MMTVAGPMARSIPAWGNAPCERHTQTISANGAAHPSDIVRAGMMDGAWRFGRTGFQPLRGLRSVSWGVAPGWYGSAPLALAEGLDLADASRGCRRQGQRPVQYSSALGAAKINEATSAWRTVAGSRSIETADAISAEPPPLSDSALRFGVLARAERGFFR